MCGLTTPANETLVVPCNDPSMPLPDVDSSNNDYSYIYSQTVQCYQLLKDPFWFNNSCPVKIDDYSTGFVTPYNYTILVQSEFCDPVKYIADIEADMKFVSNFIFDPEERSCYKIFTPQNYISPYTGYEESNIYTACVQQVNNCSVLVTQNNETVVLECDGKVEDNCVKVEEEKVCVEQLEEGCVGITTPSGLRVLFACRTYRKGYELYVYNKEQLKRRGVYFKNYFKNQINFIRNKFKVIFNEFRTAIFYPSWLPETNCYGLSLPDNETVILQCTNRELKAGCFKVTSSNHTEIDICASVYKEECVVIETPSKKRVIFDCYESHEMEKQFVEDALKMFKNGNYNFTKSYTTVRMHREGDCHSPKEKYDIQWLPKYKCWGFVTEDFETILFKCDENPVDSKPGCYRIFSRKSEDKISKSEEINEACVEELQNYCVGFITPKRWVVELKCKYFDVMNVPIYMKPVISPKSKEPTDYF